MRKKIILALLLFQVCSCGGKYKKKPIPNVINPISLDSLTALKRQEFLLQKIDTFVIYKIDCINGVASNYAFWVKNGSKFVEKLGSENSIKTDSSILITTIIKHLSQIRTEEILPPIQFIKKTKNGNLYAISSIDHYCVSKISIHIDTTLIEKSINHFYLEEEKIDDKRTYKSFKINQKTKLKILKDIAEKEILNIENAESP